MNLGISDFLGHQPRGTERPQAAVPSASRRSLLVHRPCRSGGATGLERGWCATWPERAPGPDELRVRDENLELLRAIAASKVFTEFRGAFARATGLTVAVRAAESFQLSFQDRRNHGPFCALMVQHNRTCGACLQSQSQVAEAGSERPHTAVCYAGLSETVVPLRVGNRLIGFLTTGQVFVRKPTAGQFERTLTLLRIWGLDLDREELRGAYFGTLQVSREQHAAAVKLLAIFAEHLATLSNQLLIQRDNAEPPMISKAKDFIRAHHAEDLSLPQVARVANASPFYFCKLFKRTTGLSFTSFLSRVRIERSTGLLINPQLRVSEVAYEVGFQSLSHFNRGFQKLLGQSPTEYRLKVQGGKQPA